MQDVVVSAVIQQLKEAPYIGKRAESEKHVGLNASFYLTERLVC